MKFNLKDAKQARLAKDELFKLTALDKTVEIKEATNQRTLTQNRSMHKFFELLAQELNDSGLTMLKVLKPGADVPWSAETVKECIWKPIQNAQFGEHSTTKLTTKQVSEVYETLNRHLGEKFAVHVAWPSVDSMLIEGGSYDS